MAEQKHDVEDDDDSKDVSPFPHHTFPPYHPKPRQIQPKYVPATPRNNLLYHVATTTSSSSRSASSSSKSASSSSVSSFFFTFSSSSSSSSSSNPAGSTLQPQSYRGNFRGKEAIGFRCTLPPDVDRDRLTNLLSLIGTIRHINVVQLIGASIAENEPYVNLVYAFVEGPTLSDCLAATPETTISSSSSSSSSNGITNNILRNIVSTWMSRMEIALGVARGLHYIHHCTGFDVVFVHSHIKSSNIILTRTSQQTKAMICNFGLAHATGQAANGLQDNTQYDGYLAPETRQQGIATQESDVYAFGVLLLQLLSGKDPSKDNIVAMTKEIFKGVDEVLKINEEVRNWMDKRLGNFIPLMVARNAIRVALLCVSEDHSSRPNMSFVEASFLTVLECPTTLITTVGPIEFTKLGEWPFLAHKKGSASVGKWWRW